MSDPVISAKVYVKVTLEIAAEGRWEHDCQVAQVHKQAVSGVLDALNSPETYARLIVSGKIKSAPQWTEEVNDDRGNTFQARADA